MNHGGLAARRTRKSDETRTRILNAALALFRNRGFEATTMRDIARESGVALGATYYHFHSKEAIVLAFYELAKEELRDPLERALAESRTLAEGISSLLRLKFDYFAPNKKFLGALFAHAADPHDPLSPFSEQTREIREVDALYFRRLLTQVGLKLPKDIAPHLPALLWLYQMGLILYWIYDRSENHRRTNTLMEKSVPIVVRFVEMSRSPFAAPLRKMAVDLIETVMKDR